MTASLSRLASSRTRRTIAPLASIAKSLGAASLAVAMVASLAGESTAHAQSSSPVSGTGKGIAGGALLGGEIGFLGLSAAGAHQSWMYYTIPTALAIGGGVGGYFIEKDKSGLDARVPMFMLAGGMALIIPTVVVTLSANPSYTPGNEDSTPSDATPATGHGGLGVQVNAGSTSTTTGSPSVPTPGAAGSGNGTTTTAPPTPPHHKPRNTSMRTPMRNLVPALFNFDVEPAGSTLSLGVPAVAMRPLYSSTELVAFAQTQKYEITAPIVGVAF